MGAKLPVLILIVGLGRIAWANEPPVAEPQVVYTSVGCPIAVKLQATDPEEEELSFSITSPPKHGVLLGEAPELIYIPLAGFTGVDSFTYEVQDPFGNFDVGTVKVEVEEAGVSAAWDVDVGVWQYSAPLRFRLGEEIRLHFFSAAPREAHPVVIRMGEGLITVPVAASGEGGKRVFVFDSGCMGPGTYLIGISYSRVLCLFTVVVEGESGI